MNVTHKAELRIPTNVREKVWRYVNGRAINIIDFHHRFENRNIYSSALKAQRRRFLPESLVASIKRVGLHDGAFLRLRNAVNVPILLPKRRLIRTLPEQNRYSIQAARQVEWYLGAVGYIPITEHWEGGSQLFVHVMGFEVGEFQYIHYPHKLPNEASTIAPNRPFGPALFGPGKAHKLDQICPDIVAYICIDKSDDRQNVGPYLYTYESIVEVLDPETYRKLREVKFAIKPDPTISSKGERENGFGGVTRINVLGKRGENSRIPDGREYMRFIRERTVHVDKDEVALANFWATIENIERGRRGPTQLNRGDVLLINNRLVAQRWSRRGMTKRKVTSVSFREEPIRLRSNDRTILRMSFYYPGEIKPSE